MKMAIRFWRHTRVLLILTGLAFLGACGSDTSDLTGPMLTMDALEPSTFNSQRILSGRIEAGAGLEIVVNTDARVGELTIPGDGTWECTITDLAVGGNLVTVSADDSKGNTSSLQFVLLYDLLKIDQIDTVTALPSSTVYGRVASAEGASIASVTFNGQPVALPVPGAGGAFSVPLEDLVEGTNTLTIVAENVAAGDTQTITRTISRETTAASLTIDKPFIPSASRTMTLSGTVEQGGTVAVSVEPEAAVGTVTPTDPPTPTSWQVTINDLEERDSIITVTASLEGKNNATAWTRVIVGTSPTLIGTEPANAATVSPDTLVTATFSEAVVASKITFLLSAQGDPVEGTVEYRAKDNAIIFTPAALLPAGSYVAAISGVQDPDGNIVETFNWGFTVQ